MLVTASRPRPALLVVAGILVRAGRLLLVRRPFSGSCPGLWELPGGKVEAGESPAAALAREWREELDLAIAGPDPWGFSVDDTAERSLTLLFFRIRATRGEPRLVTGSALRWCLAEEALLLAMPPLDRPAVERLAAEGDGTFSDTVEEGSEELDAELDADDPRIAGSAGLASGAVVKFRKRLEPQGRPVQGILVGTRRGARAWRNVCPHVPIPLDRSGEEMVTPDGRRLSCSTHGALFDPVTGLCTAGPCAGEFLMPLPLRRDGDGWALDLPAGTLL